MVIKCYPFLHIDYAFFCKRETEHVDFVRIILLTLWGKLQYNPHQWGTCFSVYKWGMAVHYIATDLCLSVVSRNVSVS